MNIFRILLLLIIPTLITLTSCGSDDDDNGGTAQTEEDNNTTTTGTTTGDTGGGSGCLSNLQRNRVRGMFDRAALQSPIEGRAVESFRNEDGTYDTTTFEQATINVTKLSDNSWQIDSTFCDEGAEQCTTSQATHSVAGTCYTEDNITGDVTTSSTSGFTVVIDDNTTTPPLRERSSYRVPGNGRVRINSVFIQNGLRITLFSFLENPGGGTPGGTTRVTQTVTTTGGTDTGTTTGGDTGTTTGGTTGGTTTGTTTGTTGGMSGI